MSRSRKKPIYKDKGLRPYWTFVRSRIRQEVRDIINLKDKEDYNIPNPKEMINDYDYSDYHIDFMYKDKDPEWSEKLSRK